MIVQEMEKKKYIWLTDTHLNSKPFATWRLARQINNENASGVFLTGDITDGTHIEHHLDSLAKNIDCDIFFVLGNHDYHGRTIDSVHADLRRLTERHRNLHWMPDTGVFKLNEEVSVIGSEGWYDAAFGDPWWIRFTFDWHRTFDFLKLQNMNERIEMFRLLAKRSAENIEESLVSALDDSKIVYVLTHFPPWKEAIRDEGTFLERFWLPYNTNNILGKTIERVMSGRKKKRVVVLAGHTHTDCWISVSRNIECRVNKASYLSLTRSKEIIFL